MKHFTLPLSIFVHDSLLGESSPRNAERVLGSSPAFHSVADALHAHLLASSADTRPQTATQVLDYVTTARAMFHRAARRMRVAFTIARIAERVALGESSNMLLGGRSAEGRVARLDGLTMLGAVLRGQAHSQVRYVCMAVRCDHSVMNDRPFCSLTVLGNSLPASYTPWCKSCTRSCTV